MRTANLRVDEYVDNWLQQFDSSGFFSTARKSSRIRSGVNCLCDRSNSGSLLLGLPNNSFLSNSELTHRMYWFPDGLPRGKSILLASSRIGKQPDAKPAIFDAIRTLACHFDCESQFLITHRSIATDPFVGRASKIFELPLIEFKPMPDDANSRWFQDKLVERVSGVCYYDGRDHDCHCPFQIDRYLIALSHEVRLLSVRKSGNVFSAAIERLAASAENTDEHSKTYFLNDRSVCTAGVAEILKTAGALPWFLYSIPSKSLHRPTSSNFMSLDDFMRTHDLSDFLLHWTRARIGPWPNQSNDQFLDELILGCSAANHDRTATLNRILATRMLIANNEITRDSTPVVCFSALTVDRLSGLRTFRSHLCRWDFEMVGLAICRNVLAKLGAKPVVYGDEVVWSGLAATQLPYFQKRQSGSIDWTVEQEWRMIGNLALSKIAVNEAFVFVATENEAQQVAALSRWPVVVLDRIS